MVWSTIATGKRGLVVGGSELPSRYQWNPHRGQKRWTDFVVVGGRLLILGRIVAIHGDWRRRIRPIAERRGSRERNRIDASMRLQPIDQFGLNILRTFRIVASSEQVDGRRQHTVGREAGIRMTYGLQRLDQETRADQ